MNPLAERCVLVLGRDRSGEAAAALLERRGSRVVWLDANATAMPGGAPPDLVVVSAGTERLPPLAREWRERGVKVLGERELAFQESLCLHVAVAGASGKTTTAGLIAHLLRAAGRRVEVADAHECPASAAVEASRNLDFVVHAVDLPELEHLEYFRPVVSVVLNVPGDFAEASRAECLGRFRRLFERQQPFDWVIVQSEALALLEAAGVVPGGKRITFSATSRRADLGVDHGLLVSRMEGWAGLLWDLARPPAAGPHLAEDLLAALAVGRVLRLSLDEMRHALGGWGPGPGRLEFLGEVDGVRCYDDSRSANPEALAKALVSLAPMPPDQPFVWLIAGDRDPGRPVYDLGPVLSPRVKQALLLGEATAAMRGAWSLFAPCSPEPSLAEATRKALSQAVAGDAILYSPASPAGANVLPRQHRGEAFRRAVRDRRGGSAMEDSPRTGAWAPAAGAEPRNTTDR